MTITNIHRGKGERSHIIYAWLLDDKGELICSATLDYCLKRLKGLLPKEN